MSDTSYSLADLCDLADVTPRTVRYYIAQGLLRSPGTTGPGARYGDGHLARLRLIRRLQREHLPLAEIRARLAALSDEEAITEGERSGDPPPETALDYVRGLLEGGALRGRVAPPAAPSAVPQPLLTGAMSRADEVARSRATRPVPSGARPAPSVGPPAPSVAPERSTWERHTLAPDVELHVRRPLTRSQNRAVARLLETARRLLEEDQA